MNQGLNKVLREIANREQTDLTQLKISPRFAGSVVKITEHDVEKLERAKDAASKTYVKFSGKKDWQFPYLDNLDDLRSFFTLRPSHELYVAYDARGENVVGYAICIRSKAEPSIGKMVKLDHLCDQHDYLVTSDGKIKAERSNISTMDGYKEYSGKGDLLYVSLIGAFQEGKGVGRALLTTLQQDSAVEIIDAEVQSEEALRAFGKLNFREVLRTRDGGYSIQFWRNPLL